MKKINHFLLKNYSLNVDVCFFFCPPMLIEFVFVTTKSSFKFPLFNPDRCFADCGLS